MVAEARVMRMNREWNGMSLAEKASRADARALIGIGMQTVRETKIVTHRISGSLARSVHAAPVGYEGYETDKSQAEGGADLMMQHANTAPTELPDGGWAIEVGSWMPYACVEWIGRGHPGITQGLEAARSMAGRIFAQAYREEGL